MSVVQEATEAYKHSLELRREGPLGGGVVQDAPQLDESVWTARLALRSLQQVRVCMRAFSVSEYSGVGTRLCVG
jgi:hypothetical protein